MKKGFIIQYSLIFIVIFSMITAVLSIHSISYNYKKEVKISSIKKERQLLEEAYLSFINGTYDMEMIEDTKLYKKIRYLDQIYYLYIENNSISIRKDKVNE